MKHSITFSLISPRGGASAPSPSAHAPAPTCAIRMRVSYSGIRMDLRTALSCVAADWSNGRCTSRQRTRWRESAAVINARLSSLSSAVDTLFTEHDLKGSAPTPDDIRATVASLVATWSPTAKTDGRTAQPGTGTLLADLDDFIAASSSLSGWSDGTIKKWNTMRAHLSAYNATLTMADVSTGALDGFLIYLRAKNIRNTTLAKYAKLLRWFLRWEIRHGKADEAVLNVFAPNIKGTDPNLRDIIYLELDELLYLESLPIPSTMPGVSAARDVFCFCCFTGLRHSDAQALRRTDIYPDCIRLVSKKDIDPLTIQLNDHARTILARYADIRFPGGNALPAISNQKANEHLKALGNLAGLCRRIRHVWYIGNERHEEHPQLREVLSTHCARRTFVVTSLRLGIPTTIIRSWTGHSSDAAMAPYYHIVSSAQSSAMSLFDSLHIAPPINGNKQKPEN